MKKLLIVIGALSAISLGVLTAFTVTRNNGTQESFQSAGYILDSAVEGESGAAGGQYYFNSGETYRDNASTDTLSFRTIDGQKVSVGKENFIHYNDDSMEAMAKSVIYDADQPADSSLNYYSIPAGTMLSKSLGGYTVNVSGVPTEMSNMIWKLSDRRYMAVSDEIGFCLDGESAQKFPGYVQVEYSDSGIVYLTTQQGVYSTVSSDAYLELSNGIRIYLGSKNMSTEDGIITNVSQLVVNSADTIEAIPDEVYKYEAPQPQIIVEASDGKDGADGEKGEKGEDGDEGTPGKNGESGENGEDGESGEDGNDGDEGEAGAAGPAGSNGENGKNGDLGATGATGGSGNPGEEGDPGDPGSNSSTANVSYQEEKMPSFWFSTTSDCYSIKSTITYDDAETQINTATTTITLYETESGLKVASKVPGADIVKPTGFDVEFDELIPGTSYTMVVTTEYTTMSGTRVTRDVATHYCATQSVGMTLVPVASTDSTILGKVAKTSESGIKAVIIHLFDQDKQIITGAYMKPTGVTYDQATGEFEVGDLPENSTVEVTAEGLYYNTVYYARIDVTQYKDTVESQNQRYTFPLVPFRTHRRQPGLEAPYVKLSGAENAFVLSPQRVTDPDNGIVSYRYEIYRADDVTEGGLLSGPVWSVNSASQANVKALIGGDTGLSTDMKYRARLIAVFDNNEQMIEYASPFSDPFWLDSASAWPIVRFTDPVVSPSTAEGRIEIVDASNVLYRVNNRLHVEIVPHDKLYKPNSSGTQPVEFTGAVYEYDLDLDNNQDVSFDISYKAQGLVNNTRYDVRITVEKMSINGSDYLDELLGTSSFTTDEAYLPVEINSVEVPDSGTEALKTYIYFTSAEQTADDDNRQKASGITGVGDLGHFSSKSMQYLKLSLSFNDMVYGTCILNLPEGYAAMKDPSRYVFQAKDAGSESAEKKSLGYMRYWDRSDPSLVIDEEYCKNNGFGIPVILGDNAGTGTFRKSDNTTLLFDDLLKAGYAGEEVKITAEIYDYTYMTGGKDATWVDAGGRILNRITCVGECRFTLGHPAPVYDTIRTNFGEDPLHLITKKMVLTDDGGALLAAYKEGTQPGNYLNYDPAGGTLEEVFWETKRWGGDITKEEMKPGTAVGLRVYGPRNGLAAYSRKVRYTVYDSLIPEETHMVAQSDWLDVQNQGTDASFPAWDFLLEADSNKAENPIEIKRGDTFYVSVEAELNGYYRSEVSGTVYPTQYIGHPENEYISDVTGPLLKEILIEKQQPSVSIIQWAGDASGGEITHLVMMNDLDETFKSSGEYTDYRSDYGQITVFADGTADTAIRFAANTSYGDPAVFPLMLENAPNNKKLTLEYIDGSDMEGETDLNENYAALMQGREVTIVDAGNYDSVYQLTDMSAGSTNDLKSMYGEENAQAHNFLPASLKDSIFTTYFYYDSAAYNDLGRVDLTMVGYPAKEEGGVKTEPLEPDMTQPGTPVTYTITIGNSNASRRLTLTDTGYEKTTDPEKVFHKATVDLNVLAAVNSAMSNLSGYDFIKVSARGFYDSGRYGLTYVAEGSGERTGYYALQKSSEKKYISLTGETTNLYDSVFEIGDTLPEGMSAVTLDPSNERVSVLYKDGGSDFLTRNLDYSADGLSPLPREVGVRFLATAPELKPNLLQSIMPTYTAVIEPGFSEARITLTMGNLGDVQKYADGRFRVYYQEKTETAEDQLTDLFAGNEELVSEGKAFSYDLSKDGDTYPRYDETKVITDLKGKKTEYVVRVFALANGQWHNLETKDESAIVVKEIGFRTLERITVLWGKEGESRTITYHAAVNNANTKTVKVWYTVVDAYYSDILASLQSVRLTVRNPASAAAAENTGVLSQMLAAFPEDGAGEKLTTKQTYSFAVENTTWAPDLSEKRLMDGSTAYRFDTVLTYKGGQTDQTCRNVGTQAVPVYEPYVYPSLPDFWNGHGGIDGNGRTYLGVQATKGYDEEDPAIGTDKGFFTVNITGSDRLRILRTADETGAVTATDASAYHIVLWKKENELATPLPVPGSETVIPVEILTSGTNAGAVVEAGSADLLVSYTYDHLEPEKWYMVKIYADWDNNNNGRVDVSGEDRERIEVETEWYQIPSNQVQFSSFYMYPAESRAMCMGVNMRFVNKVVYRLKVDGVLQQEHKLAKDGSGDKPWSQWRKDSMDAETYNLTVEGMTDPNATYELTITVFANGQAPIQITRSYGHN